MERGEQHAQHRLGGRVEGQHLRLDGGERPCDAGADQRLEQSLLGFDVEIDCALGDAGPGGDIVKPGVGEALRGENIERRIEDRLQLGLPRLLAARAPRNHVRLRVGRHDGHL